ncbi:hypothetical protein VIN01S_02350 [Vibrio inusitatus NBRC 102082]|uniref:Uncharacterized protein n=1 Tax=Vibrio inusitatus NBRC 102082 TaxID=1219070 RepID=A0A4Y3HR87_9VIBR|nr:hypothetical protein VIN01S_02350 [Vibrio inusitatus NBRC 102082]
MQNLDRWVYKECLAHNYLALNRFFRTDILRRVEHIYLLRKQQSPLSGALVNQENRLTMNVCNDSMIELKLVAYS